VIRNLHLHRHRHRHIVAAATRVVVRLDSETCHWPLFIFRLSHSLASLVLLDRWSTMIMRNYYGEWLWCGGGGGSIRAASLLYHLCLSLYVAFAKDSSRHYRHLLRQRFFPPTLLPAIYQTFPPFISPSSISSAWRPFSLHSDFQLPPAAAAAAALTPTPTHILHMAW